MSNHNKGKNYFATMKIIEMLTWAYNNDDVNFLYMGIYDWSGVSIKFPERDKVSVKDSKNVFVASNVEAFVEDMITEMSWQYEEYENDEKYVLGCDIGVAHAQDIGVDVRDNYNKVSTFITFDSKEELYDFAEQVSREIYAHINNQEIKAANEEWDLIMDRLKKFKNIEDMELIASSKDRILLEQMKVDNTKSTTYETINEETGEKEVVVIKGDFVM